MMSNHSNRTNPGSLSTSPTDVVRQKTALEMAGELQRALVAAGLARVPVDADGSVVGWETAGGTSCFSLRPARLGQIDWRLVVSGKPLLNYRFFEVYRDGLCFDAHQPINPEVLIPRIRSVFLNLGLVVRKVRVSGYSPAGNDDVSFNVVTDHPKWIERAPAAACRADDLMSA